MHYAEILGSIAARVKKVAAGKPVPLDPSGFNATDPLAGGQAEAVKRFDRVDGRRLHALSIHVDRPFLAEQPNEWGRLP